MRFWPKQVEGFTGMEKAWQEAGFGGEDPELKLGHVQEGLSLECGVPDAGKQLAIPAENTHSSSLSPGAGQRHPMSPVLSPPPLLCSRLSFPSD